jgi:hypothetical protein
MNMIRDLHVILYMHIYYAPDISVTTFTLQDVNQVDSAS